MQDRKSGANVVTRDFTKNDLKMKRSEPKVDEQEARKTKEWIKDANPPPKACVMNPHDLSKLVMIGEMIKLESSNFCRRLEKQVRILSDVSGLSSTSAFRFDL